MVIALLGKFFNFKVSQKEMHLPTRNLIKIYKNKKG